MAAQVRRVVAICVIFALANVGHGTSRADDKKPVTLDDLLSLRRVDWLELSKDGASLAYEAGGDLFVISTQGGPPRRLGRGTMPRWSPRGDQLTFYSTESGSLQLWVVDPRTAQRRQVTTLEGGINPNPATRFSGWVGDAQRYSWSPDGRRLAFSSQIVSPNSRAPSGDPIKSPSNDKVTVLTRETPAAWTLAGVFAGVPATTSTLPPTANQIFLVDVETGSVQRPTKDARQYFNPAWSPDGNTIVCGSSEGRPLVGFGSTASNIYIVDVKDGRVWPVTAERDGNRRLPVWSPDGRRIGFLGSSRYSGLESLHVVAATGGPARNVSASLDRPVRFFSWSRDSNGFLVLVSDGVTDWLARLNISTDQVERITATLSRGWTISEATGGLLAWEENSATSPSLIRMLRPSSTTTTLLDVNPEVKEWALGEQNVLRWANSKGDEIEGILIKPVGYQQGKRYPTIVDVYSHRRNGFQDTTFLANQTLASKGYVVFFPNHRAPHMTGNYLKSAAYDDVARGPQGGDIMLDDVMTGVDLIVRQGIADPDRLGLYGYSNGATAAVYLLTRTTRFKAAAAAAGFSDWLHAFFWYTDNPDIEVRLGATPWSDLQAYTSLSAPYHLDKVTTPLLLTVGDRDYGRQLDWVQLFNGLRRLDRDVTLVRYSDQGHVLTAWALKDYWERVDGFFAKHLKDGAPQADDRR